VALSPRISSDFRTAGGQFRIAPKRYLGAGKKAYRLRYVTVMNVASLHVPIFQPFLELAFLADLTRSKPGAAAAS